MIPRERVRRLRSHLVLTHLVRDGHVGIYNAILIAHRLGVRYGTTITTNRHANP